MNSDNDNIFTVTDSIADILDTVENYNRLADYALKLIISSLAVTSAILFADVITYRYDFRNVVPYLGAYRISAGNFLIISFIVFLAGTVVLFAAAYFTNRNARKTVTRKTSRIDRKGGKEGIVKFITSIDWAETIWKVHKAKRAFALYNSTIVGIYALMIYLVFSVVTTLTIRSLLFATVPGIYFLLYELLLVAVSIMLSVLTEIRRIRSSFKEINNLNEIIAQMRWFVEEFERSNFQA